MAKQSERANKKPAATVTKAETIVPPMPKKGLHYWSGGQWIEVSLSPVAPADMRGTGELRAQFNGNIVSGNLHASLKAALKEDETSDKKRPGNLRRCLINEFGVTAEAELTAINKLLAATPAKRRAAWAAYMQSKTRNGREYGSLQGIAKMLDAKQSTTPAAPKVDWKGTAVQLFAALTEEQQAALPVELYDLMVDATPSE